jgi:GNAT superfamily N-acetyltransferase
MEILFESRQRVRFLFYQSYVLISLKKSNNVCFAAHILYLYVDPKFRNKKIGTFLLLYSILLLKKWYPFLKKITLDDSSDKCCELKNIYRNIGFRFQDPTKFANKKFVPQGPEKILLLKRHSLFFRYYLVKIQHNRDFFLFNGLGCRNGEFFSLFTSLATRIH